MAKDSSYLYTPTVYNFTSPSYKVYNIPVRCDDFYATSKYILINKDNIIKIYTHTKCTKIRLYKIIKHHLILFINKKCIMNILYKILLNISKACKMEDVMKHLRVDDVVKSREVDDGFLITYRDNKKVFYNSRLEVEERDKISRINLPIKINTLIKTNTRNIQIKKNEILIDEKSIVCKNIKKVVGDREYLFVRNQDCIKAIYFGE
ncbi:hypothetical protein P3W45_001553 [Vairimorpha bombi]